MRYELATLKDVFDKVPSGRIMDCLSELASGMMRAKAHHEAMMEVGSSLTWPEVITWVDDGRGEVDLYYYEESGAYIVTGRLNVATKQEGEN